MATNLAEHKIRDEELKVTIEKHTLISALPETPVAFLTAFRPEGKQLFKPTDPVNVVRNGWSPLLVACFYGFFEVANALLDCPDEHPFELLTPEINGVTDGVESALYWCLKQRKKTNICYQVIQKIIDRSEPDFQEIRFINALGIIPIMKMLINAGYDINNPEETNLYDSVRSDVKNVTEALSTQLLIISGAADIGLQGSLEWAEAFSSFYESILNELHNHNNDEYESMDEISKKSILESLLRLQQSVINMVQFLRDAGNIKGSHNLFQLVQTSDCRQVESLLNLLTGFDPYQYHEDNILLYRHGNTLLHLSSLGNQPKMIQFLVERGFLLTAQNDQGHTPLDLAVLHKNRASISCLMNIIQMQINRGVFGVKQGFNNPEVQDRITLDAIHMILSWLWTEAPRMIDSKSGPLFATTTEGKKLIALAFEKAHTSLVIQAVAKERFQSSIRITNYPETEFKYREEDKMLLQHSSSISSTLTTRLKHATKAEVPSTDIPDLYSDEEPSQAQILESLQDQLSNNSNSTVNSELKMADEATKQIVTTPTPPTPQLPSRPASELRLNWLNRNFPMSENSSAISNSSSQNSDREITVVSSLSSSPSTLSIPSSSLSYALSKSSNKKAKLH